MPGYVNTTILNFILNPYDGKRPKHAAKNYNLFELFNELSTTHTFPFKLPSPSSSSNANAIDNIMINEIYSCTPGGRGCVGKERMGVKLMDRQVAVIRKNGTRYNPKYNQTEPNYGFLMCVGEINYANGTTNIVKIPVESSGIIGIRMKGPVIDPLNPRDEILNIVNEIQTLLFRFFKIKKTGNPKIAMMNCAFNLYDNPKTERRRIQNYKKFLNDMHTHGFGEYYKKPNMPWLTRQNSPCVMKASFKSKYVNKNDEHFLPTIAITPFGYCEILGITSFGHLTRVYKLINTTFGKIKSHLALNLQNQKQNKFKLNEDGTLHRQSSKRTYVKKTPHNISIHDSNIKLNQTSKKVLIQNKLCSTFPKYTLRKIADLKGVSSRGTKKDICERIQHVLQNTPPD